MSVMKSIAAEAGNAQLVAVLEHDHSCLFVFSNGKIIKKEYKHVQTIQTTDQPTFGKSVDGLIGGGRRSSSA
jgi:hypothetical protein